MRVNRDTQSLLLLLLGGAVLRISADTTFLRYVKAWTRPYLLLAGAVLVVLGVVSLWREHTARRASRAGADPPASGAAGPLMAPDGGAAVRDGHDHADHAEHGPQVAWLLLLPVFAIFLVGPPALGSYAAARGSNNIAEPAESEFAALPAGDPVTTTLSDYATRAIWDQGRSLQGRRVRLVGFVTPRPGGGIYVTRLVITCCAADARPIKISVQGIRQSFAADSWIEVVGTYGGLDAGTGKSSQVPLIKADSVQPARSPSEPYES
jgi:uncharacterized repeat protein (TIGR03943 family)